MKLESIPKIKHTNSQHFILLAGPCAIEGEDMTMHIAETIVHLTDTYRITNISKGSLRKANRSRMDN